MQIDNFADWIELNIDDLGKIITGSTPPKSKSEFYGIEYPFYKPTDLNAGYNTRISIDGLSELGIQKARFLPENTILVTCIGATIGKVGIIRKAGACNQQINAIIPYDKLLNHNFIYFQTIAPKFQKEIMNNASATTLPLLNKGKFEKLLFYICPLPEQRAIVAKIEQLFSDLDNGIANLKKAQEQLKIYRQAVLKKAFEGELTRKWREEHTDLPSAEELLQQIKEERERHYQKQLDEWKKAVKEWEDKGKAGKKPSRPKKPKELPPLSEGELKDLPELPDGWVWSGLRSFAEFKNGINFNKNQKGDKGILTIDVLNMYSKCVFVNLDKLYWVNKPVKDDYVLKFGDILFVRSSVKREGVGWASAFKETSNSVTFCGFIIRARLQDTQISPEYVTYFLRTNFARELIISRGSQVTITNISQDSLGGIPVPLAPVAEQHQIVSEIETRLSVCDKLEETIAEALQKSEALRQSILKKAFEGKLLNEKELEEARNAPDWEPADKLLERIKTEKEKPGNKKLEPIL